MTRQRLVGYLWFFRQTPMKFHFWLNGEKINPPAGLRALARKLCITCIADFGPNVSWFFLAHFFFLWAHQHETFRDQSAMQGEYLSQKLLPAPIYNPIFLATNALLGIKKFLVAIFVKRQIKLRREWFSRGVSSMIQLLVSLCTIRA